MVCVYIPATLFFRKSSNVVDFSIPATKHSRTSVALALGKGRSLASLVRFEPNLSARFYAVAFERRAEKARVREFCHYNLSRRRATGSLNNLLTLLRGICGTNFPNVLQKNKNGTEEQTNG